MLMIKEQRWRISNSACVISEECVSDRYALPRKILGIRQNRRILLISNAVSQTPCCEQQRCISKFTVSMRIVSTELSVASYCECELDRDQCSSRNMAMMMILGQSESSGKDINWRKL